MAKNKSHTSQVFHDLLIEIPVAGKPIHNLLERKGGIMKKIGGLSLILITMIILAVAFLVWLHYQQPNASNSPTATQSGNNNFLLQNSPNATFGVSDKTYKQMQEGMLAIQKLKDAELRAYFNVGYILFTATEKNIIVPKESPIDNILKIDWKSGYNVSFTHDHVSLKLPRINYYISYPQIDLNDAEVSLPRIENYTLILPWTKYDKYKLIFRVVSTNEDSITIAMGIRE